jgi:hypothetical protein
MSRDHDPLLQPADQPAQQAMQRSVQQATRTAHTSRNRWLLAVLMCWGLGLSGCGPRIIVRQNPCAEDPGLRYYRPKPYLLISALEKDTNAATDFVSITLDYLPDFSEEYAIDVRPGLGLAEVSVGLEDGWNLVSLNQKLDSQTDENIKATGELLKSVAGLTSPASGDGNKSRPLVQVPAHNVPLGYYEAVIGRNRQGKKQLYGFRYVGFMPFQECPLELCGSATAPCSSGMLYGLAFEAGVMTFKPLGELATVLPPGQQLPDGGPPAVPMTRNFSRTWSSKSTGNEPSITIQDMGSVPIAVPVNELERR